MLSSAHLAADDFVDAEFRPIERELTIRGVSLAKPPAGGKEKPCLAFAETEKTALLANGEIKALARMLRRAETDQWVGAKVVITSAEKKFAGQPTTGMKVVRAYFPKVSQ
jgi:hypothetical protein